MQCLGQPTHVELLACQGIVRGTASHLLLSTAYFLGEHNGLGNFLHGFTPLAALAL
jgi:hypothetical protein